MASSFSTLRQRGYGTFYAIRIEGIPYTFHEGPTPYRVDAESFPSAGTGYTSSASFVVLKDTTIDQEIDRHSAIARGKGLSISLAWSVLEEEGILDDLFRRPAYHTTLRSDLTATATTVDVESTADFAASGTFYIGRELIKYTSKTGGGTPTFVVDTSGGGSDPGRGYLGYKYRFLKDDPGSHGLITPTPLAWKGRFVTIYEHLLSPEGRILDSTLCEGTYQRELWKGYINAPPFPDAFGMTLSALPLIRLAGQELGSSLTGATVGLDPEGALHQADLLDYPVYVAEGAGCIWNFTVFDFDTSANASITKTAPIVQLGAVAGDWPTIPPGVMTLRNYFEAMAETLRAAFPWGAASSPAYSLTDLRVKSSSGFPRQVAITCSMVFPASDGILFLGVDIDTPAGCYFLRGGTAGSISLLGGTSAGGEIVDHDVRINVGISDNPSALAVRDIEGDSAIDFTIAATGLGVVEAGDNSEVIRWDAKYTTDYLGDSIAPYAVLRIAERMVGAEYTSIDQLPADFNQDGTIEVVAGIIADLDTAAATLLESSGTTSERGTYDTLGLGFGLGIPEAFIDLNGAGGALITAETVPILAIGRSSWGDLFSGWYAISGLCLVQRRNVSGVLQLMKVNTSPAHVISTTGSTTVLGFELAKSDVVVGGTKVPRLVAAPNQIVVDTTAGPYESADYTYNAIGRIQSEGASSIDLAIPGGRPDIIAAAVVSIMSRGLGQSIIQFKVAPWVNVELGDPVSVTVAHPVLFDWSDGTRQPSNVPGRIVGTASQLKTGEQTLTILLDGLLEPSFWLCPTTQVASVSGDDVTVADGTWFRSGETVRFYKEGNEGSEDVSIVATTVSGNVLSLASTPPGWINTAPKAYVTYPVYTSGSSDQTGAFMYDRADRRWR